VEDVEPTEEFEMWVSKLDGIVRSLRDEDEEEERVVPKKELVTALRSLSRSIRKAGDSSIRAGISSTSSSASSSARRSVEFVP